jgi:hypothetical protein
MKTPAVRIFRRNRAAAWSRSPAHGTGTIAGTRRPGPAGPSPAPRSRCWSRSWWWLRRSPAFARGRSEREGPLGCRAPCAHVWRRSSDHISTSSLNFRKLDKLVARTPPVTLPVREVAFSPQHHRRTRRLAQTHRRTSYRPWRHPAPHADAAQTLR